MSAASGSSRPVYLLLLLLLFPPALWAAAPRPGPFTFCYGLERGGTPKILEDLSLNTLYIDLHPSDMGELQPCRELVRSAASKGFKVIIGLPTCLTDRYRVSPYDDKYVGSVTELITYFVTALNEEPGVSAWATGHSLEKCISYTDADFRAYLQQGYPSLEALNAFWGAHFQTWMQVTMAAARDNDAGWPYRVGRASVDLADYSAAAYQATMALWLKTIRALDDHRPVLTGRVTLYRSLVSIPDGYSIVCVSMPPDVVENDLVSHNLHALDLARRGGKFEVLPIFRVPSNASPAYADESLRAWIQQGALHGAAGFGLESWELLEGLYANESAQSNPKWRRTINALKDCRDLRFDCVPRPTTAIVYSPYAEGLTVTGQPLYGHMREYLPGEPANLIYALRLGTRYGPVDYLSVADLLTTDLERYGALLLPACLELPRPQEAMLEEYVHGGGALLADLGLGMYQTGSWEALPEGFGRLAGIAGMGGLKERLLDLTASTSLPALPLPRGMKSEGLFRPTANQNGAVTERKIYTVSGPVTEVKLSAEALPVATGSVRFDTDRKPIFTGLVGRQEARGMALFATHALWQYWPLGDPLSQALHGGLLSRRAQFELVQSGLLSGSLQMAGGPEGVTLLNLERQPVTAQVWAYAAGGQAYGGAVCNFTAAPLQQGLPSGTALVVAAVPERSLLTLPHLPLLVQPEAEEVTVQVEEYTATRVVIRLFGAGAVLGGSPGRGLQPHGGGRTPTRLILANGGYPLAPHSRHTLLTRTRGGQQSQTPLIADERGCLDLSGVYREDTLTLSPTP